MLPGSSVSASLYDARAAARSSSRTSWMTPALWRIMLRYCTSTVASAMATTTATQILPVAPDDVQLGERLDHRRRRRIELARLLERLQRGGAIAVGGDLERGHLY